MANTSSSRSKARQRILDAAVESFQTLGYTRSTTQAIAEKAGVAEITLFRHFGSKKNLFQAAVAQIGQAAEFERVEAQLSGDLYTDLFLICRQMLVFFLAEQDAIRMLMFESAHFPEMQEALAQNPTRQIELLSRYFQKQIKQGYLKNSDAKAMAQTLVSMLFGYAIALRPIKSSLPLELSDEESVFHFVHIFLEGVSTPKVIDGKGD